MTKKLKTNYQKNQLLLNLLLKKTRIAKNLEELKTLLKKEVDCQDCQLNLNETLDAIKKHYTTKHPELAQKTFIENTNPIFKDKAISNLNDSIIVDYRFEITGKYGLYGSSGWLIKLRKNWAEKQVKHRGKKTSYLNNADLYQLNDKTALLINRKPEKPLVKINRKISLINATLLGPAMGNVIIAPIHFFMQSYDSFYISLSVIGIFTLARVIAVKQLLKRST